MHTVNISIQITINSIWLIVGKGSDFGIEHAVTFMDGNDACDVSDKVYSGQLHSYIEFT